MLRFLVVTFEIFALIMIARITYVQFWLSDMQTTTSEWIHEISVIIDNWQLTKLRNEVLPHLQDLSASQTDYLYKITSTQTELDDFNLLYCYRGDKNPYIYGANLRHICGEISIYNNPSQ